MPGVTAGRLKVRIAGIGGQGAVLLGDVLGHAAVLSGLEAATSTVYGSQARGGASRSDVIVSRMRIDFPHVVSPDVLLALAQESYDENRLFVERGGTVVYDEFFATPSDEDVKRCQGPDPAFRLYSVPATRTVMDRLGDAQPANFYMLGAVVGLVRDLEPVGGQALERSVELNVRRRFVDVNLRALRMGLEHGLGLRETS